MKDLDQAHLAKMATGTTAARGTPEDSAHLSKPESWSDVMDRSMRSLMAPMTGGMSPAAMMGAYQDWATHLATSPGKQAQLVSKAITKAQKYTAYVAESLATGGKTEPCITPLPQDRRFKDPAWQNMPYSLMYQGFLMQQQWWWNATTGIRGLSHQDEQFISFAARQFLDVASPSNLPFLNPVVMRKAAETGGMNFVLGARNWMEDALRVIRNEPLADMGDFEVGRDLAVTPGKVVYANHLMELIQYTPTTDTVHPEPILITPAWIMKYYILDLSPENSLVKFLVSQGFTVFMISWRNPGETDRDFGMDDYLKLGPLAALDAVTMITGAKKVHGAGYCLGGTLLTIAAAKLARDGDERLASVTLLAAQSDFTEAGELMLFINESQVTFLEDMMWRQGYLDSAQMSGAFQLLRSNDLIWSYMTHDYMMGERTPPNDMMAWNADSTRMPFRMHSEYLRWLFLENRLATGHYEVDGRAVALTDIHIPVFAVGTETDHIAPWHSVHKCHLLFDAPVTFVLTNGGHNAGIVSEPGHKRRHFHILSRGKDDTYYDPEDWLELAEPEDGSWWPRWTAWLADRSSPRGALPPMGSETLMAGPWAEAPGRYVMMK